MAGHNKWSKIKHVKGRLDAKRGKVFTKLIRELTVASRLGGTDPDSNPRLRSAISAARAENMPKDNIERAIKKGSGDSKEANLEEINYEGYGPGGTAIFVEVFTENKNRSAADVRAIFRKNGGNMGENGSVSWMFNRVGILSFNPESFNDEEKLMEAALEAGAEDFEALEDQSAEIQTSPTELFAVHDSLISLGYESSTQKLSLIPKDKLLVEDSNIAKKVLKLLEALEDYDDVGEVYTNADFAGSLLED